MTGPNTSASDDLNTPTNAERAFGVSSFMAKATAGVLAPVGGGVLAAAFDLIVTDPAVRRRDNFLMDVNVRLTELEQAGMISAKDLESSDEISALLLKAVQTATRSSGKRKLEALKEVVVKGVTAKEAASASHAQVMLSLIDRMTEYHMIALQWMNTPKRGYTLGQLKDNPEPGMRESLFYGQPVYTDKASLANPSVVYYYTSEFALYVEHDERVAFQIAEAELVAMGLTEPIYGTKEVRNGREISREQTSDIVGHKVSSLGEHLLRYIGLI